MIRKTVLAILIISTLLLTAACGNFPAEKEPITAEKETVSVLVDYPWYESVEALYGRADLVIEGKVISSRVEWMNHAIEPSEEDKDDPYLNPGGDTDPGEMVTTIYTVEVHDIYKGSAGETIELMDFGGETDSVICTCPDAADIEMDAEYVLFLSTSELRENAAWLLNPTQGLYRIQGDTLISDPDNPLTLTFEDLYTDEYLYSVMDDINEYLFAHQLSDDPLCTAIYHATLYETPDRIVVGLESVDETMIQLFKE